jgi:hypothetical protein
MTDNQFYILHKKIGKTSLEWRWKFIGMLPEAYERRIHEKKGYESIFVYAAKIAGLSHDQVRKVLNLEKKFKETPSLHSLLIRGEVSHHKLARVASIANPENEKELVRKVKVLSQGAIETMVRDFKSENGLVKPSNESKSVRTLGFQMNEELQNKLNELTEKGLDVNEILLELLEKREKEIEDEKEEIAEGLSQTDSRYIPVKVRKVLKKEHGKKCSIRSCRKPAKHIHHTQLFSISRLHDPRYLAPLCKEHHEIAHSVDQKVQLHRY